MSVRFLADECCPSELVAALRGQGYDVLWIVEEAPGAIDDKVMEIAANEGRVLITEDKDFGELAFRTRQASSGVCLIRLPGRSMDVKISRLSALIAGHSTRLSKCFTVVERDRFRFRALVALRAPDDNNLANE